MCPLVLTRHRCLAIYEGAAQHGFGGDAAFVIPGAPWDPPQSPRCPRCKSESVSVDWRSSDEDDDYGSSWRGGG